MTSPSPSLPVPGSGEGDAAGPGGVRTKHFRDTEGQAPTWSRTSPAGRLASSRQPRPGSSAARHAIRGQLGAGPRPGPAAGHDQPARGSLWITRGQPCAYPRLEPSLEPILKEVFGVSASPTAHTWPP